MTNLTLQKCIHRVRMRLLTVGVVAGLIWATGAALAVLLVSAWLDLLWELSAQSRLNALWTAGITGIVLAVLLACKVIRFSQNRLIARRLDRSSGSGGVILTGVELDETHCGSNDKQIFRNSPSDWPHRAVCHAAEVAGQVSPAEAVPLKTLRRPVTAFTLMMSFTGSHGHLFAENVPNPMEPVPPSF